MELIVDGQPRQAAAADMRGVLEGLRQEMAQADRAIVTIFIDGRELSIQEEEQLFQSAAAPLGRVEVRTAPAAEWGRHVLGDAAVALNQLGDEFRAAAELFRGGKPSAGLDRSNNALAAYADVVRALVNAANLARIPPPAGLREALEAVTSGARHLEASARAADSVAAADILEYELPERLAALAEMVKAMRA